MPLLELVDITKNFGGVRALDRVSLGLEAGTIVGLIGPNGSGKTTLFNIISGFLRPDAGQIRLNGMDLVGLKPYQICHRGIGRTFQLVQPFVALTVRDNVAAAALFGRQPAPKFSLGQARDEAWRLLELGKLAARADRLAGSLTLSERKRLEMLRALATAPRLLLLDEVMAGLTPYEAQEMMEVVRTLHGELGLTILLIEHRVKLVMGLSSTLVVLNFGQLLATGNPGEVLRRQEVVEAYLGKRHREWDNATGAGA
jgi:branched-chain amino acid transport system ATP-binding protein